MVVEDFHQVLVSVVFYCLVKGHVGFRTMNLDNDLRVLVPSITAANLLLLSQANSFNLFIPSMPPVLFVLTVPSQSPFLPSLKESCKLKKGISPSCLASLLYHFIPRPTGSLGPKNVSCFFISIMLHNAGNE